MGALKFAVLLIAFLMTIQSFTADARLLMDDPKMKMRRHRHAHAPAPSPASHRRRPRGGNMSE